MAPKSTPVIAVQFFLLYYFSFGSTLTKMHTEIVHSWLILHYVNVKDYGTIG